MSPARRRLLSGVVALLLGVGLLAALLTRGGPVAEREVAAQDLPGPVLLVPGYGGGTGSLEMLAATLRADGREALVVRLPGDATGDLRESAQVLGDAADAAVAAGAPSVDVVGFSAGGVVARLWATDGGAEVARRIVTLGSPHHGTSLASLGAALVPGACPIACQQLTPASPLLAELNEDETPAGPQWLTVWTTQDETVTPPESARLEGAVDVPLQQLCPGLQVTHGQLPTSPVAQALVRGALSAAPLVPPSSTVCTA